MRLLIALLALSLLACGEVSPVSTPPPEAPPAPRLAVPTVPRSPVVALQGEPLVITRTAIELSDGPAVAALVDGRVRAEDRSGPLSIPALRDRVAAMPADWAPTVAVHPDVPFATVGQAVYTLGNAGRTSLGFVARVGEDLVVIPIWLPNARNEIIGAPDGPGALADVLAGGAVSDATGEAPAAPRDPSPDEEEDSTLHLVLRVGGDGVWVTSVAGRVAPGCEVTTSERSPTVPRVDGAHDLTGLTACLEQTAREYPDEDRVMVTADPDVPFGDFAQVMAVTRTSANGQPLFPTLLLSLGVF